MDSFFQLTCKPGSVWNDHLSCFTVTSKIFATYLKAQRATC